MSSVRTPASSCSVMPPSCSGQTGTTSGEDIELWVAAYVDLVVAAVAQLGAARCRPAPRRAASRRRR